MAQRGYHRAQTHRETLALVGASSSFLGLARSAPFLGTHFLARRGAVSSKTASSAASTDEPARGDAAGLASPLASPLPSPHVAPRHASATSVALGLMALSA